MKLFLERWRFDRDEEDSLTRLPARWSRRGEAMDGGGERSDVRECSGVSGGPNLELQKLQSFKVYRRRWFVLLVLCLLNCSNATVSSHQHQLYWHVFTFTFRFIGIVRLPLKLLQNKIFVWKQHNVKTGREKKKSLNLFL